MIKEKVCHCFPGDMEGGSIMEKVTNSDIGGRGSFDVWHFGSDVIFEWCQNGLKTRAVLLRSMSQVNSKVNDKSCN